MIEFARWEDVPHTLKTKTQLSEMGLRVAKGQEPTAIKTHWKRSIPDYNLYEVDKAVPKRKPSEAQAAALTKAQAASVERRTCKGCGYVEELGRRYRGKTYVTNGYCPSCRHQQKIERDHVAAAEWARSVLAQDGVLILDTETTGLHGEVIELAIIDTSGAVRFNSRFKPQMEIEPGAAAIHGLTNDMLVNEPDWAERHEELKSILALASVVLIYNEDFDISRIGFTCRLHYLEPIQFASECIMLMYARYYGAWSRNYRSYRWQPLEGGDHTALGDCAAALEVVRQMAAAKE